MSQHFSRLPPAVLFMALLGGLFCLVDHLSAQNTRRPGFPKRLFNRLDKDGDGKLSAEEFGRPRLFRQVDKNADGGITLAEAQAHFRNRVVPQALRRRANQGTVAVAKLAEQQGTRLSVGKSYDNQPALAVTANGTTFVASVRHHDTKGDDVAVVRIRGDKTSKPAVLTSALGQYIRPALVSSGNEVFCVWTTSEPEKVSSIWFCQQRDRAWSKAKRLVPNESRAHQNPEIAATADGRVAVVYQVHTGTCYDIHLVLLDGGSWQEPRPLSSADSNDWDPVAAFDAKGTLHVVWSGFRDGDYDLYLMRVPGQKSPKRISARGEYDLHPWLTAAPDGTVWASWDVVRIPGHASSGRTTITDANPRHTIEMSGRKGAKSWVEVRVLDGDVMRVPGKPRQEIRAPKGYQLAHNGLAKVAIGTGGEPWVFYRVLRRKGKAWLPQAGIGYYWDLLARPYRDGKWQEPLRFAKSDGYLEEASFAPSQNGIRMAYGGERRADSLSWAARRRRGLDQGKKPARDPDNHHHDYNDMPGCNGDIHLTTVGDPLAQGPKKSELAVAPALGDQSILKRNRITPYEVEQGGKTYRLLWGDTHKHSNISRCSAGAEPSPDDLYRYGTDICRYDFFALSDHAEHLQLSADDTGYYYWWLQQKLADLYHVPGFMSVLYNYEWTMTYPHGHHNTIFPTRDTVYLARNLAASNTLAGGWKILAKQGLKAITIPHTGADPKMGTAWEVQDDRYQRLCEIFQSCRGSYEHAGCPREFKNTGNKKGFYWNALEKGYHVGVIASSDHGYGVAYACVYALENSRQAVWQAMWDRRTYGSTTYGLVLELRSGEHWMGEEWSQAKAPLLEVFVRGAVPIRSVEILGRSQVLHAEGSVEKPLNVAEHRIRWSDPAWAKQSTEQWYYVRVIQTDDEIAWSSPVWVEPKRKRR